ncbi:hypothetical protein [Streptomyces sp. NPDC092307]|uniref:hypothetical protein n=1 Tax=Streptomyces sp. NPDC092307 TaxID=3366013 RepID=UPI0038272BC1
MREFETRGPVYRRTVRTALKASYNNHDRRGLIKLLDTLEVPTSNHAHRRWARPWRWWHAKRALAAPRTTPLGETVPVHKAMGRNWAEVVHRTDKRGRRRVVRMVYRRPVTGTPPLILLGHTTEDVSAPPREPSGPAGGNAR